MRASAAGRGDVLRETPRWEGARLEQRGGTDLRAGREARVGRGLQGREEGRERWAVPRCSCKASEHTGEDEKSLLGCLRKGSLKRMEEKMGGGSRGL